MTSTLITLLAAGLAAQAVVFLQQAGYLDVLAGIVWETSGFSRRQRGRLLHTLIGYMTGQTARSSSFIC